MAVDLLPVVDDGLGNTTWLVNPGDGRALATPGHTDEQLSFLLLDGSRPLGVFTGGSLVVGAAARTDLGERSPSRCGTCSRPGSAGPPTLALRCCASATPTRTPTRSSGKAGTCPLPRNVELGALADGAPAHVGPAAAVMCGHGERAMTTAASLLERAGHDDLAVVVGGPDDWSQATGRPLSR